MKFGLSARLIVSHTLVAVAASGVFAVALLTTVGRQAVQAGVAVDYATALRIAPTIEEYLNNGADPGTDTVLPPMMRPDSGGQMPRSLWPEPSDTEPPVPRTMGPRLPRPEMMERWRRLRPSPVPITMLIERPIVLVDRSGRIAWERGDVPDPLPRSFRPTEGVPVTVAGHRGHSSMNGTGQGELYLFVGGMIDPSRNPLSQAFTASTTRAATLTGIVLVVAAVLVSVLWARVFLRPIRDIRDAAAAIAVGDFTRRVSLRSGRHELSDLARDFNEMAREVEAQEESRRRFVGDAAHELRTPIALLTTRVEMLRNGIYPTDNSQWDALSTDLGRISRLVDDLQTLARADAGKLTFSPTLLDLTEMVEEICTAVRPVADAAQVSIKTRFSSERQLCSVDPTRFRQVMTNLLSNAIRYTPSGSSITVETGGDSDHVWIVVEDAGPGIPLSDRERVFHRFVRLDPARDRDHGGSGLGLAIAAEFVRRQRGTIEITEPRHGGSGTRFLVTFPAVNPASGTSDSSKVELE